MSISAKTKGLAAFTCLVFALFSSVSQAQQFWMAGIPVIWLNKQINLPPNDFFDAFKPEAPWQQSLSKVEVLKIPVQLILFGSDDQIREVFSEMQGRHIKMAIEIGSVVKLDACGGGEGYAAPDLAEKVGRRIAGLGFTLDYMALDEPVWFAHEQTWGNGPHGSPNCAYPLAKVASLAAMSVAGMRKSFPSIEVGEIEPISPDHTPPAVLIGDYVAFASLLEHEIGRKLAFFHADVAWLSKGAWLPLMKQLSEHMRLLRVPVGAIIGGDPADKTAEDWTADALEHLSQIDCATGGLDQIVIQSWQVFPKSMLPETRPGTLTYLLLESERAYPMACLSHGIQPPGAPPRSTH